MIKDALKYIKMEHCKWKKYRNCIQHLHWMISIIKGAMRKDAMYSVSQKYTSTLILGRYVLHSNDLISSGNVLNFSMLMLRHYIIPKN